MAQIMPQNFFYNIVQILHILHYFIFLRWETNIQSIWISNYARKNSCIIIIFR